MLPSAVGNSLSYSRKPKNASGRKTHPLKIDVQAKRHASTAYQVACAECLSLKTGLREQLKCADYSMPVRLLNRYSLYEEKSSQSVD